MGMCTLISSYLSAKTYAVVTQLNSLNEMVLFSNQNVIYSWIRKKITILCVKSVHTRVTESSIEFNINENTTSSPKTRNGNVHFINLGMSSLVEREKMD